MASGAPASALTQTIHHRVLVQFAANINLPALDLLEMTLQTQIRTPLRELLGINASMRRMTNRATFAQGCVLEDKRSRLGRMALQAILILRH